MQLKWEQITFWNREQMLICRRLEDDFKMISRKANIKKIFRNEYTIDLLNQYEELEEKIRSAPDKYRDWIYNQQMKEIVIKLTKPEMERRQKDYEDTFIYWIWVKRQGWVAKYKKDFLKKNWYPCREDNLVPPF